MLRVRVEVLSHGDDSPGRPIAELSVVQAHLTRERAAYDWVLSEDDPAYQVREDGRIERLCAHGVGHTVGSVDDPDPPPSLYVHGCDGCCRAYPRGLTAPPLMTTQTGTVTDHVRAAGALELIRRVLECAVLPETR